MRFSVSINHQQAHPIIHLKDKQSGCQAEIYAFGGLINALRLPLKGKMHNCIDGFISVADARKNISKGFKSAKLSPFVCRMKKGTYAFKKQQFTVHKHYLGEHAIHGLIYDAQYQIKSFETSETNAMVQLVYSYESSDHGYPFAFDIELIWKLHVGNKVSVTTKIIHQNRSIIPYADGWHPYFTLGGKVDNCVLQFNSNTQLIFDNALLPTGKRKKDNRFIKGSSLKEIFLDNSFEFSDKETHQCVLQNKQLKLTVEAEKSYPILQIYTPPSRKSIAIENLTGAPDNFNNTIGLLLLEPNKLYSFTTAYTIEAL
jgi:aldose 1-epimerase